MMDLSALVVLAADTVVAREAHGTFTCSNCDDGTAWWQWTITAVLPVLTAGLAAWLTFLFSKKLIAAQSDAQTKAQLGLMSKRTQHEAAKRLDTATAELAEHVRAAGLREDDSGWGLIGEIVRTRLFTELGQLDEQELANRVDSLNTAILQAYLKPSPMTRWGVLCACDSLRGGLAEFIQGKPMSPTTFPTTSELMKLLWDGGRTEPNIAAYTQVLTGIDPEGKSD